MAHMCDVTHTCDIAHMCDMTHTCDMTHMYDMTMCDMSDAALSHFVVRQLLICVT